MQSAHIERPEPQKDQPALSLLVEGPSVVWPVQFIVQMHPEDPVGVHHLHPLPVYGNMSWGGFSWTTSSMIFLRLSWRWFTSNRETSAVSCPYIIFLIIVIMCREIDFFFFVKEEASVKGRWCLLLLHKCATFTQWLGTMANKIFIRTVRRQTAQEGAPWPPHVTALQERCCCHHHPAPCPTQQRSTGDKELPLWH